MADHHALFNVGTRVRINAATPGVTGVVVGHGTLHVEADIDPDDPGTGTRREVRPIYLVRISQGFYNPERTVWTDVADYPGVPASQREANADRLEQLARAFFSADAGERVGWVVTHWAESIVEGGDVRSCREFLRVHPGVRYERINAFYDSIKGLRIISSTSGHEHGTDFTPR